MTGFTACGDFIYSPAPEDSGHGGSSYGKLCSPDPVLLSHRVGSVNAIEKGKRRAKDE